MNEPGGREKDKCLGLEDLSNGHGEPSDLGIAGSKVLWALGKGESLIKEGILVSVASPPRRTD